VLSPNGGEHASVGQPLAITWSATDNVGVTAVDVLLSRTGPGGPWETIASGIPNSGSTSWTVTGPPSASAFVRVVAHDAAANSGEDLSNAAFDIVNTAGVGDGAPLAFALGAVTPNPMRGLARVAFALPVAAHVQLRVYDTQGREVVKLADRLFPAGRHEASWNARGRQQTVASGIYFVRMDVAGRAPMVRRVALIQ
jgi:hypothetical protein